MQHRFERDFVLERLLLEVGEDVWRVHDNRHGSGQSHDRVDVQQKPVENQRHVHPVVKHL